MRNLEAAAKVLERMMQVHVVDIDLRGWANDAFAAQFVADYGCDQCGGTHHVTISTGYGYAAEPCPAEHVKLPNPWDGTVVNAGLDKCEWRCADWEIKVTTHADPEPGFENHRLDAYHPPCSASWGGNSNRSHLDCGWVPKPLEGEQP